MLRRSLVLGGLFGVIMSLYVVLTNLFQVGDAVGAISTYMVYAALIGLSLLAGWRATQTTGDMVKGALAGLLVGCVGALIANLTADIISVAFFDLLRQHANEDKGFINSGMSDYGAFLLDDNLGGLIYGTAFSSIIGAVVGLFGGYIGKNNAGTRTA